MNAARSGRLLPKRGWPRLSAGRYDSFIIRVFRPSGQGEQLEGQVTHVATHRSLRFTDLQRAIAFMREQLARPRVPTDVDEDASPG